MAIRIETKAFTDMRFKILGKRLGIDKWSARARCEDLWEYCTQHETYYLTKNIIDTITECENFAENILHEDVALATSDKYGIYINGTDGRIEWLSTRRNNGKKGGRPKKPKANLNKTKEEPKANPILLYSTLGSSTLSANTDTQFFEVEFQKAWDLYPNKLDKGDAKIRFFRLIKNELDTKALLLAIPKYVSDCTRQKRLLKNFSTFLGTEDNQRWREWIDRAPPKPKQIFHPLSESTTQDDRGKSLPKEYQELKKLRLKTIDDPEGPKGAA